MLETIFALRRCGLPFLLLILAGCGGMRSSPEVSITEEAGQLLAVISRINSEVTSIKGIGKLHLRSGSTPGSFRFAWTAVPPDRVRVELIDPGGRPAATLARDGTWTYLRIHKEGRLVRRRSLDRQVGKWLSIPVKTNVLIALLSGRVPFREHDAIRMIGKSDGGPLLVLEHRNSTVERIEMTPDGESVARIDMFDTAGKPAYRIEYENRRGTDNGGMPLWLDLSIVGGESMRIRFLRYWENVPIDPATFILEFAGRAASDATGKLHSRSYSSKIGCRFTQCSPSDPKCV